MSFHVMHDIESMDNRPSAAILSIGAVLMDIEAKEVADEFYVPIDLEDCLKCGLTKSADTEAWWTKQSEEARKVFTDPNKMSLLDALTEYSRWWRRHGATHVWANGTDFDTVILSHAFDRLQADPPWKFWNTRCYRTMKNVFPLDFPRGGTHHNAVDDARYQAQHLFAISEYHSIKLR